MSRIERILLALNKIEERLRRKSNVMIKQREVATTLRRRRSIRS